MKAIVLGLLLGLSVIGAAAESEKSERCEALGAYAVGLVRARDLGKTRSEADKYALERVPAKYQAPMELMVEWREKAQEAVYSTDIDAARVRAAMVAGCK